MEDDDSEKFRLLMKLADRLALTEEEFRRCNADVSVESIKDLREFLFKRSYAMIGVGRRCDAHELVAALLAEGAAAVRILNLVYNLLEEKGTDTECSLHGDINIVNLKRNSEQPAQ